MSSKKPSTKTLQFPAAALDTVAILGAVTSPVLVLDRNYTIHYANHAAQEWLGAGLTALQHKEISNYLYPTTHILQLLEGVFERKAVMKSYELELSLASGSTRHVNLEAGPLFLNHAQTMVDFAVMLITPSGAATRITTPTESNPAASMAAMLAHEIKNPLSGIRGAAQLLQKHVPTDKQNLTSLICSEVDRVTSLINEMEVFSTQLEIKKSTINVHDVVHYVKQLAEAGTENVQFRESHDPTLPAAWGNRDLLIQLILNLAKNAAAALHETPGATITFSTAYSGGFRYRPPGREDYISLPIVITVEDNGPGIPEHIRTRLFEPFVTTREGGKGLGLAIVAKIVTDHDGVIQLEDVKGEYTRFKVYLPAAKE